MNIAFPAFLILLIVLPGIILRYFYLRGFWANSPFVITALSDEIAYGLFWAAVLHLGWASLLALFGVHLDLQSALVLLIGSYGPDQALLPAVLHSLTRHPAPVAGYFIGMDLIAVVLGLAAHSFVRKSKLDRRVPLFRFKNDWHYLISGEILEFREARGAAKEIDGVYLSAVVKHDDGSYLYRGIVADYYFDKTGNLDRVLLRLAHRRLLANDRARGQPRLLTGDERYYDIVGDFFVLRYAEMQTINIEYILLTETTSPPAAPSADGDESSSAIIGV